MAEHYSTSGENGILPAGLEFHFRGPMKFGALGQRISGHGGDEIRVLGTRILDGERGADFVVCSLGFSLRRAGFGQFYARRGSVKAADGLLEGGHSTE